MIQEQMQKTVMRMFLTGIHHQVDMMMGMMILFLMDSHHQMMLLAVLLIVMTLLMRTMTECHLSYVNGQNDN